MEYQKALDLILDRTYSLFTPPPELSLSEWSDKYARLSPESSAEPGAWQSIPYQRGIMDAFTDPTIERITVMKSARVGYTKILNNCIGYHAHLDPCNVLVVQPTIEDAQGYSKDEVATMVRDTPILENLISDPKAKDGRNTILKKSFPGGTLYLVGANSPRGFRRISARLVLFDEVDGYPPSAGTEGDQIKLGIKRTDFFWNRKIVLGSTPTLKGFSKIERSYENSDKRRYWVPCPHCGEFQTLKWSGIQWPKDNPLKAFYVCEHNACIIDHSLKADMVEGGEWRGEQEFNGHAGFHIWAAYSYSPNAAWGILAQEFLDCKKDSEALQTFVNTTLGETWEDEAEKLDHSLLMERAEDYPGAGDAQLLTAGVDIQKDRIEMGIEGWAAGEENWQVDYLVFFGDTTEPAVWDDLKAALSRSYTNAEGADLIISATCIDSGYLTDLVYAFVKKHQARRVFATKGQAGAGLPIVNKATKKKTGRDPRPVRLFNVGVDGAKAVIYHRLNNTEPGAGYRHLSNRLAPEYYEGLTAEKIVTKYRRGFEYREWVKIRPRNEPLDIAVLNLAALKILNPSWEAIDNQTSRAAPPQNPAQFRRRDTAAVRGRGFNRR
jgi:phage terminase large subunit GpA-like protein